jgi:hypothetical protein
MPPDHPRIRPVQHPLKITALVRGVEVRIRAALTATYEAVTNNAWVSVAHEDLPQDLDAVIEVVLQLRFGVVELEASVAVVRVV